MVLKFKVTNWLLELKYALLLVLDTSIHEVIHTLIVCIKQMHGVFHMGLSLINKTMSVHKLDQAMGA